MATLVSCTECERFVRSTERTCPFCSAALTPRSVSLPRRHVARAAMVTLALAGGCAESMPLYGAPPTEDTGPSDAGPAQDAGDDAGAIDADTMAPDVEPMPMPLYGGAPPEE